MFTAGDIDKVMEEGQIDTALPVDWTMTVEIMGDATRAGVIPDGIALLELDEPGFLVRVSLPNGLRLCSEVLDFRLLEPKPGASGRDGVIHILNEVVGQARALTRDYAKVTGEKAGVL